MAGFDRLASRLAALADVPGKLPPKVAEAFSDRIEHEFVSETDPYGNAWKQLKKSTVQRKGHDRIMFESGDMLADTKAVASGDRIEFVGTNYGPIHQKDGANRPARPAVPNDTELPDEWQSDIRDEFGNAVKGTLST